MRFANWIRDHLCDVHFQSNGATGGWTVKTWVGFADTYIVTEHADALPPTMDEVVEAVLAELQPA